MIIHEVEQRSDEWFNLRCGVVTASNFYLIMQTGKSSNLSMAAQKYALKIAWEQLNRRPLKREEEAQTYAMKRGSDLEPLAREAYEQRTFNSVSSVVGFVTTDCGLVGCSPDGFVGNDGMIETKCCQDALKHVAFCAASTADDFFAMYADAKDWRTQVLSSLFVTEREWCDLVFYDNEQCDKWEIGVKRIYRDLTWETEARFKLSLFFEHVERLKSII